jgi:hypothetical protein
MSVLNIVGLLANLATILVVVLPLLGHIKKS